VTLSFVRLLRCLTFWTIWLERLRFSRVFALRTGLVRPLSLFIRLSTAGAMIFFGIEAFGPVPADFAPVLSAGFPVAGWFDFFPLLHAVNPIASSTVKQ